MQSCDAVVRRIVALSAPHLLGLDLERILRWPALTLPSPPGRGDSARHRSNSTGHIAEDCGDQAEAKVGAGGVVGRRELLPLPGVRAGVA